MIITHVYAANEPLRSEIDELRGPAVLEFGSPWCGFCRRAEFHIQEALSGHPDVRHIKIADASGRQLGRSFRVKLWPTLVFLKDGQEVTRVIRPVDSADIRALASIDNLTASVSVSL